MRRCEWKTERGENSCSFAKPKKEKERSVRCQRLHTACDNIYRVFVMTPPSYGCVHCVCVCIEHVFYPAESRRSWMGFQTGKYLVSLPARERASLHVPLHCNTFVHSSFILTFSWVYHIPTHRRRRTIWSIDFGWYARASTSKVPFLYLSSIDLNGKIQFNFGIRL